MPECAPPLPEPSHSSHCLPPSRILLLLLLLFLPLLLPLPSPPPFPSSFSSSSSPSSPASSSLFSPYCSPSSPSSPPRALLLRAQDALLFPDTQGLRPLTKPQYPPVPLSRYPLECPSTHTASVSLLCLSPSHWGVLLSGHPQPLPATRWGLLRTSCSPPSVPSSARLGWVSPPSSIPQSVGPGWVGPEAGPGVTCGCVSADMREHSLGSVPQTRFLVGSVTQVVRNPEKRHLLNESATLRVDTGVRHACCGSTW